MALADIPAIFEGCKLFPVVPGGKEPAIEHGWHKASSDPAQLAQWQALNPDFNWAIAMGPSGLFGIDIDPNGLDYWAKLLERDPTIKAAVDRAFQVRTPRGGLHVYFRGEGPSTASRIADGIDTRGGIKRADGSIQSGGYLLLPGSKTNAGSYSVLPGGVIDALPDVIRAIVPERQKTDTLGLEKNPDKDLPRNIKTAMDLIQNYVKTDRVAVEGKGGDNLTFAVCASIMDKGISPGLAFDMLWEHWNPHCQPPWDDWELETKVRNAAKHGEDTESGAKGHQSNQDAFSKYEGMAVPELAAPEAKRSDRNRIKWLHDFADSAKDPVWLVPDLVPASGVGMLYGFTGSYKSFIALDWALCLAYGISGQWGIEAEKRDVLYFAGEGAIGTAKKRWPAWMDKHDIEFRNDHRFMIFERVPFFSDSEEWEQIKIDLHDLKAKPALIILDTMARLATGLDESSTKDATLITNFAEQLAAYYECFVLLIHHEGKDASKGARGSSAFISNVDMAISTKKAEGGTKMRVRKQKDADVSDDETYLKVEPRAHDSIVLTKSLEIPSDDSSKSAGSSYGWASRDEVLEVLTSLGGETSEAVIVQHITSAHGLDKSLVRRQLMKNPELKFLRDGMTWKIPDATEYDL